MALKDMADYLPGTADPDYGDDSNETDRLILTPHNVMTEQSEKNQVIHTADDNSEERISFSNDNIFVVSLSWQTISESETGSILDFFFSATKGNGITRTFLWQHPTDTWCQTPGNYYIVRFTSSVARDIQPSSIYNVKSIKLRVIDKYQEP